MQHQHNLTELGLVRLRLFQTFCLPTLRAQTNPNFLWILYVDPQLVDEVKQPLLESLHNQSNILVVPTLQHYSLRQGIVSIGGHDNNKNHVWSGDVDLAMRYYEASRTRILIDTRLDADDGLAIDYVNRIQQRVQQDFLPATITNNSNHTHPNDNEAMQRPWNVYCVLQHTEWHHTMRQPQPQQPKDNNNNNKNNNPYSSLGYMITRPKGDNKCITPGLTMAFGPKASHKTISMQSLPHSRIAHVVPECSSSKGNNKLHCWQHIYRHVPGAIRARTPTSAGMDRVRPVLLANHNDNKNDDNTTAAAAAIVAVAASPQESKWNQWETTFGINRTVVRETQLYFLQHLSRIAKDNLKGQCTAGHSCKRSAKQALRGMISTPLQQPQPQQGM